MKQCRLCKKMLKDEDTVCVFCGYDFKTDTVSQSFQPKPDSLRCKEEKEQTAKGSGVSSGVKKFALTGLAIVIFSIFYKYNFNINSIAQDASLLFNRIKTGKFTKGKSDNKAEKEAKKIELISVRFSKQPEKISGYENLKIEGIFFDTNAKSFIVVNGKVIPEGQSFDSVTVKKINKDSVELIIGNDTKVLRVNQSIPFSGK